MHRWLQDSYSRRRLKDISKSLLSRVYYTAMDQLDLPNSLPCHSQLVELCCDDEETYNLLQLPVY